MTCYSVQVLIRDQNEKAMENKCVEPKAHSPFRFMISTIDVDQFKGSRVHGHYKIREGFKFVEKGHDNCKINLMSINIHYILWYKVSLQLGSCKT